MFLLFITDIFTGSVAIPLTEILNSLFSGNTLKPEWATILLDFRLPKALTAVIAGTALSVSGLEMQTYFRNPLAGPFVLGISAGASLGVAILVMGISLFTGSVLISAGTQWSVAIASWAGSGLVLLLILAVSLRIKDNTTILILGILFGSITLAIVSILQYSSSESEVKAFIIWTLGSLGNVTGPQLRIMIISVAAGLLIALFAIKGMNVLLLGEQYTLTMGINIRLIRILIFTSTSILAGTITAFCGPIGFIGIAVPHIARIIFQSSNHRILLPGTLLLGSSIMLISDIISHLPGSKQILPINSVTAIIGIPVVVWIIVKKQRLVTLA
ncbi:MAG: iron ABC transporter [Bacteroides sp. SM23_62_1]|nr:MAG: iron ABC transporter [Bacteroides sp. SM23_62_1]